MVGVAAGLALTGKRPIVYTIIPFLTMRAFEQIRMDVCIQNLPVTLVGVGGGLAYGHLGATHHAIEDVAILRALPNMTVLAPCDPGETRLAMRAAMEQPGPVYLRLGKNGEPPLHQQDHSFEIGRSIEMRPGDDAAIVSSGPVTKVALEAANLLEQRHVEARVIDMHTIKPLDTKAVLGAASQTGAMVSIEEHSVIGGLGSAVAETLAEGGCGLPFRRIGIRDTFCTGVGSQEYHLARQGVTAEAAAQEIIALLGGRPKLQSQLTPPQRRVEVGR